MSMVLWKNIQKKIRQMSENSAQSNSLKLYETLSSAF